MCWTRGAGGPARAMKRIAALDLGSNALRMAIASLGEGGGFRTGRRERIPLRLGTEAFAGGRFTPPTMARVVSVVGDCRRILDGEGVGALRAMATSAFREAENSGELVRRVREETGVGIEVISGETEAGLIADAVRSTMDLDSMDCLLFDIGGGSVELSVLRRGRPVGFRSLPLGTVRLLARTEGCGDDEEARIRGCRGAFAEHRESLEGLFREKTGGGPVHMVGTGGNFKRLLKLRNAIVGGPEREVVVPSEVDAVMGELGRHSYSERMERFDLGPDRADVIIPALCLVAEVAAILPVVEIHTPDTGLIDGIFLSMIGGEAAPAGG